MALQFNHKPSGSLIGEGTYKFRHFGEEGITDLTGTTWVLNLDAERTEGMSNSYGITYTSSNSSFVWFFAPLTSAESSWHIFEYGSSDKGRLGVWHCGYIVDSNKYGYYNDDEGELIENDAYQTISITGGTDVTNTTLIDWLYDNAVLQG